LISSAATPLSSPDGSRFLSTRAHPHFAHDLAALEMTMKLNGLLRQNDDVAGIDAIFLFGGGERQPNFNHQAALRPIRYSDRAAMETNRPIRYGQAQADAAGLPTASVVDAIKRTKQFVQGILGHTRARVGYAHNGFSFDRTLVV
jgi:hypothetical protein